MYKNLLSHLIYKLLDFFLNMYLIHMAMHVGFTSSSFCQLTLKTHALSNAPASGENTRETRPNYWPDKHAMWLEEPRELETVH